MLEVLSRGMYVSIQDFGRPGFRAYGIPRGGVLDPCAAALANRLVGNGRHAPLLEFLLEGPVLKFHLPALVAITGGDMQPQLGGTPVPMYRSFWVEAGDTLSFGTALSGRCAYLSVAGGFRAQRHFGSCATYPQARLGGLEGRPLQLGDVLKFAASVPFRLRSSEPLSYLRAGGLTELSFSPGPDWERLPEAAKRFFVEEEFSLDPRSNRAGFYFDKPIPLEEPLPELLSSPVAPGCVQLTGGGALILLMPDGPTVGGYHRIACLSPEDRCKAAQLPQGGKLKFRRS